SRTRGCARLPLRVGSTDRTVRTPGRRVRARSRRHDLALPAGHRARPARARGCAARRGGRAHWPDAGRAGAELLPLRSVGARASRGDPALPADRRRRDRRDAGDRAHLARVVGAPAAQEGRVNDFLRKLLFLPEQSSTIAQSIDYLHYFVIITTMIGAAGV